MTKFRYIRAPKDVSPQLRGLYGRVARQLGVDPSYVSQVARGEMQSALVEDALRRDLTEIMERRARPPSQHEVQFYSDDEVLLDRAVPFVAAALKSGDAAIIIATKLHRDSFVQRLKSDGFDVNAATLAGKYVAVDAADILAKCMIHDRPKSVRLFKVMGGLIEEAMKAEKKAHPRVAVFGEGVSLLCEEGKVDAAIRVEQLRNQLAATYEVDILCGYRMSGTYGEKGGVDFKSICAEHSAVYFQWK